MNRKNGRQKEMILESIWQEKIPMQTSIWQVKGQFWNIPTSYRKAS